MSGPVDLHRETSLEYWSHYHVDAPDEGFSSVEDSLAHFEHRSQLYPGYLESMPVDGADGKAVLDYGCGPGNDLVGFGHFSRPSLLVGVDVSPLALKIAARRIRLHGTKAELHLLSPDAPNLLFDAGSIDLVHCSGVLHHIADPIPVLREFRRILKPSGHVQIMVYHRDSLWLHLYVAYVKQIVENRWPHLSNIAAFQRSTDGEDCPISRCWSFDDLAAMAAEAGLACEEAGVSMSTTELKILDKRWAALEERRLNEESRQFLYDLTINERGWPVYRGRVAGINLACRLRPL